MRPRSTFKDDGGGGESDIVAWIAIRKRGGRYQLSDFGVDKKSYHNNINGNNDAVLQTSWAMKRLLGVALNQVGENVGSDDTEGGVSLLLPTFVLSEMKQEMNNNGDDSEKNDAELAFLDMDNATEENDDGWMYANFYDARPSVLELTTREVDPIPHFIWPTDSF